MANLFSSGAPQFFPSSAVILLVVWSANGDYSAVNLLNDDPYRCYSAITFPVGYVVGVQVVSMQVWVCMHVWVCICRLMSTYKDLLLSLHMQTYVYKDLG